MLNFVKSLFGFDTVVNTATKIVDKIAGTDWTPKDKADFLINYANATKHQSPARRFIAMLVTIVWFVLVLIMALSYVAGNAISSPEILMIAKDVKTMLADLIKEPFNYIIMFYFAMGILNGVKK
jgi:hypothetical protein